MLFYWITFAILLFIILFLDIKTDLLRDKSIAPTKPYSFANVQILWWTLLIIPAWVSGIIISKGEIPTFGESTLILLGISAGTLATAKMIDASDEAKKAKDASEEKLSRNQKSEGFFKDILSDLNGTSPHRLQVVLFNSILGIWMIVKVNQNLKAYPEICKSITDIDCPIHPYNFIIPEVSTNNLILLGLSVGTYAVLKNGENK